MSRKLTKQALKTEATRQKILKVAKKMMRESGFENTSIRDICSKAGVSTGSFYNIFSSKEELLLSVFDDARIFFVTCEEDLSLEEIARSYAEVYRSMISNIGFDYFCEVVFACRRGNKLLFNEDHPSTLYLLNTIKTLQEKGKIRKTEDHHVLSDRIKSATLGALYYSMCVDDPEILYSFIEANTYAVLKEAAV